MNIFYLDSDPVSAAKMHNDKHVVKMILETSQLLCTAHRILDGTETTIKHNARTKKRWVLNNQKHNDILYHATHINHPSNIWARKSSKNYEWLYNLFIELCKEYKYRYGKTHLCETKLKQVLSQKPKNIPNDVFTQPPQAMPEEYQADSSVKAYRTYYIKGKSHLAKWTKRPKPVWYRS